MLIIYLRNGTKVEHTLVPDPRHVLQDIGHVLQCVCDEKIETVHGIRSILLKFEVSKVLTKLAPCLEVQGGCIIDREVRISA